MNPIIRREKLIEIRSTTDEMKQQVNKYFDLLFSVVEQFHCNILSDNLSNAHQLTERYKELIAKNGNELTNMELSRILGKMDNICKYIESKVIAEKERQWA